MRISVDKLWIVWWNIIKSPFQSWLIGDGSVGPSPVLALIPPFWDKPQKGSDDYGKK